MSKHQRGREHAKLVVSNFFSCTVAADNAHEPHHSHHTALFFGNTQKGSKDGLTVAVDYAYRLNALFGIGGIAEYVGGDFDAWVFALPLYIFPYKDWRFLVAPGLERKESESDFILRVGVAYPFSLGDRWTISPEFNIDLFEREEALVYGLSFGYGF